MRILYVEDELSKNIPRLMRLFTRFLNDSARQKLQAVEGDPSGYGASEEDIKNIVDAAEIEIDYRFPDALRKVIRQPDQYALFIVDRNLSVAGYRIEEVITIDPKYTVEQHARFFEREGDYLLQKLVFSGIDVLSKFYFLTAHPSEDEIRNGNEIETLLNFGQFKRENFIEKGNAQDFKRLQSIIDTITLNLQGENRIKQYYERTLAYHASHNPEVSLLMARKTAEAICRRIFEREISSNTNTITFVQYIERLSQKNILPQHIIIPLRTIQHYGNYGAHAQESEADVFTTEYVTPAIQALATIFKWYMSRYHLE